MFRCAFARTNSRFAMVVVPPHLAERKAGQRYAGGTPPRFGCSAPEPRRNAGSHPPRGFCWCWERVSDRLAARTRPPARAGGHLRAAPAGWRTWRSRYDRTPRRPTEFPPRTYQPRCGLPFASVGQVRLKASPRDTGVGVLAVRRPEGMGEGRDVGQRPPDAVELDRGRVELRDR